jgi:hypothetical protein
MDTQAQAVEAELRLAKKSGRQQYRNRTNRAFFIVMLPHMLQKRVISLKS